MNFKNFSIKDYTDALASEFPTPGGGTTSSLSASLGVSFISMIAKISMTKIPPSETTLKKMPLNETSFEKRKNDLQRISDNADTLRQKFLTIMDSDSAAYNKILNVNTMSKKTAIEQAAYKEAKQEVLQKCISEPLCLLRLCLDALDLANELSQCFYKPTASDLALVSSLLKTASEGAYLTIQTNLKHIEDEDFAFHTKAESRIVFDQAMQAASDLYQNASNTIMR